ncbi:TPA: AAA family ATPase [Pseudomonas aeruginosa]|jgi:hypothetical protein|uniref:AAA family ATPase n=1 Tax=Burkholderia sp. LMG 13014 TaxID=2709306 RepID=UPI0019633BE8|nr:AAA family ATPase [Burkholderia sp. LMG 13014]HEJ3239970.1 AAA family ATPase [Pseudomonas aeruginosa]
MTTNGSALLMQPDFPYRRVNIVGAPGSGTTTLGRALAARCNFGFADADDYYWQPTNPPFQEKFAPELRLKMMLAQLQTFDGSVVAGSVCGWGQELEDSFDLVVFLSLSVELRLQRIQARENTLFGGANPAFLAWAAQYDEGRLPGRSRPRHEAWLAVRRCRVLRFDEDQDVDQRIDQILEIVANRSA